MVNASKALKNKILDYYYTSVYQEYLFSNSLQSKGINYFEKRSERVWQNTKLKILLKLDPDKVNTYPMLKASLVRAITV